MRSASAMALFGLNAHLRIETLGVLDQAAGIDQHAGGRCQRRAYPYCRSRVTPGTSATIAALRARQRIEQRRFADIGPADDGDDRQHRWHQLRVPAGAEGVQLTVITKHQQQIARHHRGAADALLLANRDPRDRIAGGDIEPVHETREIPDHHPSVIDHRRRQLPSLEPLDPPLHGAGATIQPHQISLGGRRHRPHSHRQ